MVSHRLLWRVSGFFFVFLLSTQIWAFIGKDKVWRHSYVEAEAEARELKRPLLLHFHASWCGPCRQMDADVLNTGEVKRILLERVIGVKVDLDQHPELAEKYGVESIPADVIITPEGKVIKKSVGFQQRDQYVAALLGAEKNYIDSRPKLSKEPDSQIVKTEPPKAGPELSGKTKIDLAPTTELIVALEGYCPVSLWRNRQWVKGKSAFGADYQGVRFYFASLEDRDDFIANPGRYAPQLLGCDPVALWESERAIAGTSKYAAYFDGELYLFNSVANRDRFKASPPQFTRTRHVNLEDIERAATRIGMKN